jgi:microcystin-dependent protein
MNRRTFAPIACALAFFISGLVAGTAQAELVKTAPAGAALPFPLDQPYVGLNYLVRVQGDTTDMGEVKLFAGDFAPRGYAIAQGQVLAIAQNTALHSVMGTTYGGNGTSTFALPDLRGRAPVHVGQGLDLSNWTRGQQLGQFATTFTEANLPTHLHSLPADHPEPETATVGSGAPVPLWKPSLGLNHGIATQLPPPGAPAGAGPMLGRVKLFAGPTMPSGYAQPNGQLLATSLNPALHGVLGQTFGGDGQNTFALPDLRSRATMGVGTGAGLTVRSLGATVGDESFSLSYNEMPSHAHALLPLPTPPDPVVTTGVAGGTAPLIDLMQPTLALRYMIATQGVYPIELDSIVASDQPMLGEIALFAGDVAPAGWVFAEGQELPITGNLALYSVIESYFGGVSGQTFKLPDLRGRLGIGFEQGSGLPDIVMGERAGRETFQLTANHLATHTHDYVPIPEPTGLTLVLLAIAPALLRRTHV